MSIYPENLARMFHEAYERLAPDFGYKTREASSVPWEDVPEANRSLMLAVATEIATTLNTAMVSAEAGILHDLLRLAADDPDFDPSDCRIAVATTTIHPDGSWWPFEPGEIVVFGEDGSGREPWGSGRKDKWDVNFELFGHDLPAARRRSAEVRAATPSE